MANIGVGELANHLATIVAAQALGYLKANTVLAQLVARDWDNDVAQYGKAVSIPIRGALSANAKAADTAVTLQTPSDTVVTVNLNQHFEVSFLIEDIAIAQSRPDAVAGYAEDAMKVLAEQIDGAIAALYSGFSQTIDATTGLGEDDFREARRQLNAAKAPMTDRFAVLHEDAEYEALAIEKLVNRDYRGDQAALAMSKGFLGEMAGFQCYMDQKVATSSGQCKNLFFQRNAIALVTRPLPAAPAGLGVSQSVQNEDGVGIRATVSYNPSQLGWQLTFDCLYGLAELRDSHGVVVSTTEI